MAGLSVLYTINSNHCLLSKLPSASTRVRQAVAAAAAHHPLEFEVSRCRTSQFARHFLLAQVPMTFPVFDTGKLDGFKSAVNRRLLP